MKKILFLVFGIFYNVQIFAYSKVSKEDIIPSDTLVINEKEKTDSIFSILAYIRDSIWGLLALIAITIFIWIGAKLIMARGNPEEFKKALMQFIYAVIGIVIVALSWALVRIASSLNF